MLINPLEYLNCNKSEWFSNVPMMIAQKSTRLWLGKGFLFNSEDEKVLKYLNKMNMEDKWFEKFYQFGLQNSLIGKCYILLVVNQDGTKSIRIPSPSFQSRVAKYNEQEQAAELWFMSEQADSATLTWVTITKDKVTYETFWSKDKNQKEIIIGSVRTKVKPKDLPKTEYSVPNPFGYLPIFEVTNLPVLKLYGNSSTLNVYPDCYPVWDLIPYYHKSYRQRNVDRELNVTTAFGYFDNATVKEMTENNPDIIKNPKKDLMVNVGSASYNRNGQGNLTVIQGNFQAENYIKDKDDLGKTIWNGAGYDYEDYAGVNYENKTKSLMNNKHDMETTETKISHYSVYLYRLFDLLLISEGLWNGKDDRPYSFNFLPIAMTDQLLKAEYISKRVAEGTMSYKKAIAELDEVNLKIAENELKEIIKEQKLFGDDDDKKDEKDKENVNKDLKEDTNDPS